MSKFSRSPTLELPVWPIKTRNHLNQYYQTFDWNPRLAGISSFFPPTFFELEKNIRFCPNADCLDEINKLPIKILIVNLENLPLDKALAWNAYQKDFMGFKFIGKFDTDLLWLRNVPVSYENGLTFFGKIGYLYRHFFKLGSVNYEVKFSQPTYPPFLMKVEGLSGVEPWGRWSDTGDDGRVRFYFKNNLPKKFRLIISANAFGPNVNNPINVIVGNESHSFSIKNDSNNKIYEMVFDEDKHHGNFIEFLVPKPVRPMDIIAGSSDARLIGLGFISLKVVGMEN
jgi:hypothetical protein